MLDLLNLILAGVVAGAFVWLALANLIGSSGPRHH